MGIIKLGGRGKNNARESKKVGKQAREAERKRAKVLRLLRDPKWADRSTNWVAMQAGVSWLFADKVRIELDGDAPPKKRKSRAGQLFDPYTERK